MKPGTSLHWRKARNAFSLVELLTVIAIIAMLAALLLPALTRSQQRAQRIVCLHNLQQIGLGFHAFANDHAGNFPMAVPLAEGGSQEFVTNGYLVQGPFYFSYRHFQSLAAELVRPNLLLCPVDVTRTAAESFSALQNSNVSYFVGVEAKASAPNSVLAGDRNLTRNAMPNLSIIRVRGGKLHWTQELHEFKGNVLFADGHVEEWNDANFAAFCSPLAATLDLFMPTTMPGTAGGATVFVTRPATVILPISPPRAFWDAGKNNLPNPVAATTAPPPDRRTNYFSTATVSVSIDATIPIPPLATNATAPAATVRPHPDTWLWVVLLAVALAAAFELWRRHQQHQAQQQP